MEERNSKRAGERQVRGGEGRGEKRGKRGEWREGRAPTWHGRGPPRGTPQEGDGTGDEHRGEP